MSHLKGFVLAILTRHFITERRCLTRYDPQPSLRDGVIQMTSYEWFYRLAINGKTTRAAPDRAVHHEIHHDLSTFVPVLSSKYTPTAVVSELLTGKIPANGVSAISDCSSGFALQKFGRRSPTVCDTASMSPFVLPDLAAPKIDAATAEKAFASCAVTVKTPSSTG